MVLHNDKWKWKNKVKHLRKVGNAEPEDKSGSEESEEELITNTWRFEELQPIQHPKDEEQLALEREQRALEQEREEANASLVLERLKLGGHEPEIEEKQKDAKKMTKQDLLDWEMNKKDTKTTSEPQKSRVLSKEEKDQFYELQKRIERQKMVASMKKRFAEPGKGRVLEVAKKHDDNYKAVNSLALEEAARKQGAGDFEESLANLIGDSVPAEDDHDRTVPLHISKPTSSTSKPAPFKLSASKKDEDFLDDLLG
ncbi:hypothetical protein OGAPHI_002057 [Ogataea philodendri]|uniref:Uncharacterized protein n=1 Tax=Ogataea philodendri TaxID=1378263 RepID=A0A9P8P9R4_9ASCO|nr:uncharacterized protein OGAPHI_002057 [Ogataea philodendri]KAH3668303.1 hypothetical protein OGAPHI_002057 [Ogataea philodendri]